MFKAIADFLRGEEGLTMVEYAVAGVMVTLGAYAIFKTLGTSVSTKIGEINTAVNGGP